MHCSENVLRQLSKINGKVDWRLEAALQHTCVYNHQFSFQKIIQSGGKRKKYQLDGVAYYVDQEKVILEDNQNQKYSLEFVSFEPNPMKCGIIIIDQKTKTAIVQDLIKTDYCVLWKPNREYENVPHSGAVLMEVMIHICQKAGIEKIVLTDNSGFTCSNGDRIEFITGRTLTHGFPYYTKFGFLPKHKGDRQVMKKNRQIMGHKKTSDVNLKKIIRKVFPDLGQKMRLKIKEKLYPYLEKHSNDPLCKTLYYIMDQYCNLFHHIYMKVYQKLHLEPYASKKFVLKLE